MNRPAFCSALVAVLVHPRRANASTLQDAVERRVSRVAGTMGVYVRTMDERPALVSVNAGEPFPAASTIKVLIMLAAFKSAALGLDLRREPVRIHSGGQPYPMRTLILRMIRQSDNDAANALIAYFGFAHINAVAEEAGLTGTRLARHFLDYRAIVLHNENVTTARDMGTLLHAIERGAREGIPTVASPADCRHMIDVMLGQEDREKIPAGLPRGTHVANKTGEITGVRSDVAIVEPYGDVPYVIAVLTKSLRNYASGVRAIGTISRTVYEGVSSAAG